MCKSQEIDRNMTQETCSANHGVNGEKPKDYINSHLCFNLT